MENLYSAIVEAYVEKGYAEDEAQRIAYAICYGD